MRLAIAVNTEASVYQRRKCPKESRVRQSLSSIRESSAKKVSSREVHM